MQVTMPFFKEVIRFRGRLFGSQARGKQRTFVLRSTSSYLNVLQETFEYLKLLGVYFEGTSEYFDLK